ncbi:MAG TPA: ribosomal protein S18-alanine N-acetyltransferase [Ilumatobacter sp.]|nr:ribosomal protein S18-alanine N-acetyltransferase [Ilumatobacter sp.]
MKLIGRSSAQVQIGPLRRRHLRQVLPIESVAYPTSWSRNVFESELDQVRAGSRYYLVAQHGHRGLPATGTVVGYAGLWFVPDPDGNQAHVTNIVVAEPHRRSGIATRLMLALAGEARRRGCTAWTLEVRASSEGAQQLYRRFGFAPAGVRKNYYDHREDALVMWCHDIGADEYAARLADLERGLQ